MEEGELQWLIDSLANRLGEIKEELVNIRKAIESFDTDGQTYVEAIGRKAIENGNERK